MNRDELRSNISKRFKRVEQSLHKISVMNKGMMMGCSALALLHAANIVKEGLNISNGLFFVGLSSSALALEIVRKSMITERKNFELEEVLKECDKKVPDVVYDNNKIKKITEKMMIWTAIWGAMAFFFGKIKEPNFCFLLGAVSVSCMSYRRFLIKKNRKILSAEFPKGVIDEHSR